MSKYSISTSIAYINTEPHIGYLFELVAADVLARYQRLQGSEVFFLTGTDEHGTKIEQAAEKAGQSPKEFADDISAKFAELKESFGINYDYFIRTTDPCHQEFVSECWQKLAEKNILQKKPYVGYYCVGCEAFKTEREIVDGKCIIHEKPVEKVTEENYFLQISPEVKENIVSWLDKGGVSPSTKVAEIKNWLKEIDEVSVSRPKEKLNWGIDVPNDAEQVMYVWLDALLNYLSGIKLSGREIGDFWPAQVEVIGKDILKFHAVIWPTILLELGYDLPEKLIVHGFINIEGKKMSKSLGNFVTPAQLKERYGSEATRYLLMRQLNFYDDSNFSFAEFDTLYNGELANGIGNLLARTIGLKNKNPQIKSVVDDEATKFEVTQKDILINSSLKDNDFAGALEQVNSLIKHADNWISEKKAWQGVSDGEVIAPIGLLFQISAILEPFMPETAVEIRIQLKNLESKPLFPRLTS